MSNIESLINFSIKHHAKIKKLCAPLYETFGITNFWCAKTNFDGSHVAIESNIDYFDYYYSEKIYRFNPVFENPKSLTQGCYFYKNIADKDLQNSFHAIAEKKRSLPLIGFVIKQKKDEVFRLGYAIDPKQSYRDNVFTSNLLLFNEFNHYFCREAQDLIAKVQNYAINLKDDFGSNFNNKDDIFDISLENKCQFLSRIQGKNLENVMKLSPREIECMKYLHQGLSTSQISEKMFLSPRTIETHIIHIKNKLGCHKKSDLYNYITLLQAAV